MALRKSPRKPPTAKKKPAGRGSTFYLASLLFFLSGGTGLVYQVVWFKRFSHVWGSSSLAFAAVGASFLLGLGVGAYLFGRIADRVDRPLRRYGACELAIGLAALVIPFEIAALVDVSAGLYAGLPNSPLARYLVQCAVTLIVIGPPCALMGGTLPLLIRELTDRRGSLDQSTGWLYAVNTFGAAAGCYLSGFHLLPSWGIATTNTAAAAVNVLIGLVAVWLTRPSIYRLPSRERPAATKLAEAVPSADAEPSWALRGLALAAGLAGCAALILEMTWSRQLALVLGGSTYAYTATLFVVLLGIGSGSMVFHAWLRPRASSPWTPLAVVAVLAITTLEGKWSLPWLALSVAPAEVRALRAEPFSNGAICAAVSAVLELLPGVAMGILFPLFVHLTRANAARVGSAVGKIYAWNTLGSIFGASLTALVLFPWIGTAGAMALAIALYVVALLAVTRWRTATGRQSGLIALFGGAAVVALLALPADPRDTNLGLYLYGDPRVDAEGNTTNTDWTSTITPILFREGSSANIMVGRRGQGISLRVNGKVDASDGADMENQLGLAYLPLIFRPEAREVLVIGFGSGCTSGAALQFPNTRVTCCEIEPAVYEAAELFAAVNHRPQDHGLAAIQVRNAGLLATERLSAEDLAAQARFTLILGDGRTVLAGSDKKYDLIISEPSNPWVAGVSNLFTREYFHMAREHLVEGGVLAAWIQSYGFTISDYLLVARTLRSEFPYYAILLFSGGADTVLLASDRPLLPDGAQVVRLQKVVDEQPRIAADLTKWCGGSDLRWLLLKYYQLDQERIDQLIDGDPSQELNTDLNMQLEFSAPLAMFRELTPAENAGAVLQSSVSPAWLERLAAGLGVRYDSAECQAHLGAYAVNQLQNPAAGALMARLGAPVRAAAHLKRALTQDPANVEARRAQAKLLALERKPREAAALLAGLVKERPNDAELRAELAMQWMRQGRPMEGVAQYREALRLLPELSHDRPNVTWANNLAWALATNPDPRVRNGAEAVAWARKACAADARPRPSLLDTLAAALAEDGQFDEAIKVSRQFQELVAAEPALVESAEARIRLFQASQPFHEP